MHFRMYYLLKIFLVNPNPNSRQLWIMYIATWTNHFPFSKGERVT